jgi:hypothetical protein
METRLNKPDTVMTKQDCYKVDDTRTSDALYIQCVFGKIRLLAVERCVLHAKWQKMSKYESVKNKPCIEN